MLYLCVIVLRNCHMPYWCKNCKNVIWNKKFLQSRFLFVCFSGFASSLLKYKKFFNLEARTFYSRNIRGFFGVACFYFVNLKSSFLKYKKILSLESSISRSKRNFLILELESSISWNIRNFFGVNVFYFFDL